MGLLRRGRPRPEPVRWVRVAYARHQPEAEMLAGMLAEIDVPVVVRRATMDVPEMLAGGPRELLVPADRELEARALLDPLPPESCDG
jgi:hypothetical protein